MAPLAIHRKIESILGVLSNHNSDNKQPVSSLLQVYNNALSVFQEDKKTNSKSHKHAFIVLEGLDGCGKSTVCRKLASRLGAARWCTPPESIKPLRSLFDDHPQLRTAYYELGNYIAALECSVILKKQPVVMDRYWHSTSAYAIAQAVYDFPGEVEIPPEGDGFYHWPDDLIKPDVVLFLDVDEKARLQRLSRRQELTTQEGLLKNSQRFRDNIVLAYRNMVDPEVVFVDSNGTVNRVVAAVNDKVQHLFK